jgi:hypothetical protein
MPARAPGDVLGVRELNRATLARQNLLARGDLTAANPGRARSAARRAPARPRRRLTGLRGHLPGAGCPGAAARRLGERGPAAWAPLSSWLDRKVAADGGIDEVVVRYLAAFGPATVADIQTWSGLTRLRDVTERLGSRLGRLRDEHGRELLDVPDAPRPDPDTPAPPRFLPEYDNLLLSHADRLRVIEDGRRPPLPPGLGGARGTVLVDGFWRADWRIARDGDAAVLVAEPRMRPRPADAAAIADEGARLLAFAAADASTRDVRFVPVRPDA